MLFTKIIRGIAAGALALAALGAHAHTVQNTPLEKIDFQSATCTLAQEAQAIDASEENAFVYGECASGTTINPYVQPYLTRAVEAVFGDPFVGPMLAQNNNRRTEERGGTCPINKGFGDGGMPGNNQAQNKQARQAATQAGLNDQEQQVFHRAISGQGYGWQELLDIARQIRAGQW